MPLQWSDQFETELVFYPGRTRLMLQPVSTLYHFQSCQYPNLWEDADSVGGQLRGAEECPFSGVTSSSRVWRKVPESDAQ